MLLTRIERHLRHHRMTPTRFGREAAGDPNLITQMRDGRELRRKTAERIIRYLDERSCEECPCDRCAR